jgi:hypothetical protein
MFSSPRSEAMVFIRKFGILPLHVSISKDFLQSKRFANASPFTEFLKVLPCEIYPPHSIMYIILYVCVYTYVHTYVVGAPHNCVFSGLWFSVHCIPCGLKLSSTKLSRMKSFRDFLYRSALLTTSGL